MRLARAAGVIAGSFAQRAAAVGADGELRHEDDADDERDRADADADGERGGMRLHFLFDGVGLGFGHGFLGIRAAVGSFGAA